MHSRATPSETMTSMIKHITETGQLHWIALDSTGVHYKVASAILLLRDADEI